VIDDYRVPPPALALPIGDDPVSPNIGTWPGVVVFLTQDDRAVQIGATSSCRRFAATRLGEDDDAPPTRAELRGVAARVLIYRAGSAFEADWLTLTLARALDPALHATLAWRLRPPALVLRPDTGTWAARELDPAEPIDRAARVIAPIRTLEGARQLGEAIDERFELCRYPKEVLRAPRGTPCAYKEMGTCPAPCDGSEPLADYLARFGRAADTLGAGVGAWIASERRAMDDASAAMDFERAQRHKRALDELASLPDDIRAHARGLGGSRFAVVSRAERSGWCRVWTMGGSGLNPVLTIDARARRPALDAALGALTAAHALDPIDAPRPVLEEFGLTMRAMHHKPQAGTVKRTRVLDIDALTPSALADALTRCAGSGASPDDTPADTPHRDAPSDRTDGEDPLSYNTA